jgi:hypothetical protein
MTSRGGKVLVIGLCAMYYYPDPLAHRHGWEAGLCPLHACRKGWINCPRHRAGKP